MSIKPGLFAIAAAGLIVGLTGCGASTSTTGAAASNTTASSPSTPSTAAPSASASMAEPVLIIIKDFKYTIPASVPAGAKVTVKNGDAQNHTVTSAPRGAFDVNVPASGTASFAAPTKPGSYKIICLFHANMMATLVVK